MTSTVYAEGASRAARRFRLLGLALAVRQVGYEQRSFWRNRTRAFFSFLFPIIFLVLFASLYGGETLERHGGIDYNVFFVPGILAYGVIMATFGNLAVDIAVIRENGVLKRVRGTPLPNWAFLAGRIGSAVVAAAAVTTVMLAIGSVVYGVHVRPETLPGLALSLALGTACFSALGVGVQRVVRNAEAAPVVANVLVLPLTFISGVWGPMDGTPEWLRRLADFFPVKPLADALQVAFDPRTPAPGIVGHDLAALGVWTAVGVLAAIRFLRTELRRA